MNNQTNTNDDIGVAEIVGMITGVIGCITGFGVVVYVKLSGYLRDTKGTEVSLEHTKSNGTQTKMYINMTNDEKIQVRTQVPDKGNDDGGMMSFINSLLGRNTTETKTDKHINIPGSPGSGTSDTIPSIMPELFADESIRIRMKPKDKNAEAAVSSMFSKALLNNNKEDIIIGETRSVVIRDVCRLMALSLMDNVTPDIAEKAHLLFPTPRLIEESTIEGSQINVTGGNISDAEL